MERSERNLPARSPEQEKRRAEYEALVKEYTDLIEYYRGMIDHEALICRRFICIISANFSTSNLNGHSPWMRCVCVVLCYKLMSIGIKLLI